MKKLIGILFLFPSIVYGFCWHGLGAQAICQRGPGDYSICANGGGATCVVQLVSLEDIILNGCNDSIKITRIAVTTYHADGPTTTDQIMPRHEVLNSIPEATLSPGQVWAWPYWVKTNASDIPGTQLKVHADIFGYDMNDGEDNGNIFTPWGEQYLISYDGVADVVDCDCQ